RNDRQMRVGLGRPRKRSQVLLFLHPAPVLFSRVSGLALPALFLTVAHQTQTAASAPLSTFSGTTPGSRCSARAARCFLDQSQETPFFSRWAARARHTMTATPSFRMIF